MSRLPTVLISVPHEAVGAFAQILNIDEPESVLIAKINGPPINQHSRTSFTDNKYFLAPENRVFFAVDYNKSGEPTIVTRTIDFSLHTPLRRFDAVIFKIPAYGNAPKIWGSLQEFEILNARIKAATFIRAKKVSYKGEVQEGNPEVVGMFYEKNFIHDSRGKFLEYSCDLRPEWHFKFIFEKRLDGKWIEIHDPRVRQATTGAT